jgi:hypothetical protein
LAQLHRPTAIQTIIDYRRAEALSGNWHAV